MESHVTMGSCGCDESRNPTEISEGDAYRLIWFKEAQLQLLMFHWRITNKIVDGVNNQVFSCKEISLMKIATRLSWMQPLKTLESRQKTLLRRY